MLTIWNALEVLRKTMLREFNRMSAKLTMRLLTVATTTPKGRSAALLEKKAMLSPSRTTSEQLVYQKIN